MTAQCACKHAFNLNPPPSIDRSRLERVIGDGQLDDLMWKKWLPRTKHWLSNMTLSSVRVWLLTMISYAELVNLAIVRR